MEVFTLNDDQDEREDMGNRVSLPRQVRELTKVLGRIVRHERIDQRKLGRLASVVRVLVSAVKRDDEQRVRVSRVLGELRSAGWVGGLVL